MSQKRVRKRKKRVSPHSRQRERAHRRAAPPSSRNQHVLRERILKFTYQERFRDDFERAIRRYFGDEAFDDSDFVLDEVRIPGFQEWFIHDYLTGKESRIIDLFAHEVGPRLPLAQQQILDDWRRTNRLRLFEVQAVEPGVGVTVQDLLSGEVLEVNDISTSEAVVKWEVLLTRPLLTEGCLQFTGSGMSLPPRYKSDILVFAQGLWREYQAQRPQASLDDFYRDHSLELHHRVVELATTPPSVYTAEGHPVMFCTARFAVADAEAVEARLDEAEEFEYVGPADEDPAALSYVWLLVGRSHVPEASLKEQKGLVLDTSMLAAAGAGEPVYRPLGDVRLWDDRLELSCLSRERMEAGKVLLRKILGRRIRHQGDQYQDLVKEAFASAEPARSADDEPISAEAEALAHKMMLDQYVEWPDRPLPALDGKSPREAARDPALRETLEEILKSIEYTEEQRRRAGEPFFNVANLRRELGLPPR